MADFQTLSLTHPAAGVARVTMSRPAVFNAFDETMIAELDVAFTQLEADLKANQGKTTIVALHVPAFMSSRIIR